MIPSLFSTLEKRGVPFALAFFVFLIATVPMGVIRPFWYDELAARWVSESATLQEFAARILVGMEPTPPLYLFTQYLFVHTFGTAEWTGRMPSMIGYGVSLVFLYRFVARRLDAVSGAMAMAVMVLSGSIYYAQEGRPYGMIFGCTAMAMWFWQEYMEREEARSAALCGLLLFAAASLHYYSVLLGLPFGLAELYRTWRRRRLDWKMLLAAAAPGIALLVHRPLIRLAMGMQSKPDDSWSQPTFAFPAKFWERALEPGIFLFVGMVILLLYVWRWEPKQGVERKPAAETLPEMELVLLIGFVLMPVAGLALAKLVTNAITPRYVFSSMIGFSALLAHVLHRITPVGRMWVFLLLLAGAGGNALLELRWQLRESQPGQLAIPSVPGDAPLPVVVDDYLLYVQISRYASPELLDRLIYVSDSERYRNYTKSGQMELMTVEAIRVKQFRGQSAQLGPYLKTHPRFLLYEPLRAEPNESWLSHDLLDRGISLRMIAIQGGGRWYLVEQAAAP